MAVNRYLLRYGQAYAELSKEERKIFHKWEAKLDESLSNSSRGFNFIDFKVEEILSSGVISLLKLAYNKNGWEIQLFYKKIPARYFGYDNGALTSIRIS